MSSYPHLLIGSNHRRGETLLEFIFVVAVILVVLTSFLGVFITANRAQQVDAHILVAAQAAREGIEVVRAVRDTNWLTDQPWYEGILSPSNDTTALVEPNIAGSALSQPIDFTPTDLADAPLYDHQTYWDHDPTGAEPTGFTRLVTVEKLCTDDLSVVVPAGGQNCTVDVAVGARITATVGWQDSDRARQYQLTTYLYDWR